MAEVLQSYAPLLVAVACVAGVLVLLCSSKTESKPKRTAISEPRLEEDEALGQHENTLRVNNFVNGGPRAPLFFFELSRAHQQRVRAHQRSPLTSPCLTGRLNDLKVDDASALPGVGPVYAKAWARHGCKGWRQVLALYLEMGPQAFRDHAEKVVGMTKARTVSDLQTALEQKWNALLLSGSSKAALAGAASDPAHTAKWGVFVNARLADFKTLDELPGISDTYARAWKNARVTTPEQMMAEFLKLGRAQFEAKCRDVVKMMKVGSNDNVFELASALEAKWNALFLEC